MIALEVLRDAQARIKQMKGLQPRIRCFFSEANREAFAQLQAAVAPYHKPAEGFVIKTYCGEFEDAVSEVRAFMGDSFPLIFIDPTGWSGYALDKISPLFGRPKVEVLINFMYDYINRFAYSDAPEIIMSLERILGGPGWRERLDGNLPRGLAVEKLFRETLRAAGGFDYVISTKIDKATAERPHFFIAYGTKSAEGLKTFRETEYNALRLHARNRATAKERKREEKNRSTDMFAEYDAALQEASVDQLVEEQKAAAREALLATLAQHGSMPFSRVVANLLQVHMLRETNIKDICTDLAREGKIENTWGSGNRKPRDDNLIRLIWS